METKFITLFGEDNEVAQWGFDEAKIASHMRVAKDGLNTGGRYARPRACARRIIYRKMPLVAVFKRQPR